MARRRIESTPEFFLSRVNVVPTDPAACWEWRGPVNLHGYGRLTWNGQRAIAHRVAATLAGIIPDVNYPSYLTHTCGNRRCCNPAHLKAKW